MTHTQAITKTLDASRGTFIMPILLMIVTLLALYGYFLFGAIQNGGEIGRLQSTISEQSSTLGELEGSYMALKKTISIDEAYELGFTSSVSPVYLSQGAHNTVALNR